MVDEWCRRPSVKLYQNNLIKPILGDFNTIIIIPLDLWMYA